MLSIATCPKSLLLLCSGWGVIGAESLALCDFNRKKILFLVENAKFSAPKIFLFKNKN